jgi:hypothetical protein
MRARWGGREHLPRRPDLPRCSAHVTGERFTSDSSATPPHDDRLGTAGVSSPSAVAQTGLENDDTRVAGVWPEHSGYSASATALRLQRFGYSASDTALRIQRFGYSASDTALYVRWRRVLLSPMSIATRPLLVIGLAAVAITVALTGSISWFRVRPSHSTDPLIERLQSGDPAERLAAAKELAGGGRIDAAPLIIDAISREPRELSGRWFSSSRTYACCTADSPEALPQTATSSSGICLTPLAHALYELGPEARSALEGVLSVERERINRSGASSRSD